MTTFTEPVVKSTALTRLKTFGYTVERGSNIATGELAHAHFVETAL